MVVRMLQIVLSARYNLGSGLKNLITILISSSLYSSRFGPSVSDWKKVVTLREYMSQGLTDWATQHFFTSLVHFVIIWFNGNLKWSFVSDVLKSFRCRW